MVVEWPLKSNLNLHSFPFWITWTSMSRMYSWLWGKIMEQVVGELSLAKERSRENIIDFLLKSYVFFKSLNIGSYPRHSFIQYIEKPSNVFIRKIVCHWFINYKFFNQSECRSFNYPSSMIYILLYYQEQHLWGRFEPPGAGNHAKVNQWEVEQWVELSHGRGAYLLYYWWFSL